MKEVTLNALAKEKGQAELAESLGCSQSAIAHALRDSRDIRVRIHRGSIQGAYEVRPFPSKQKHTETA